MFARISDMDHCSNKRLRTKNNCAEKMLFEIKRWTMSLFQGFVILFELCTFYILNMLYVA